MYYKYEEVKVVLVLHAVGSIIVEVLGMYDVVGTVVCMLQSGCYYLVNSTILVQ